MNQRLWVLIVCLGILSTGFGFQPDQIGAITNHPQTKQISLNQPQEKARLITVKILSSKPLGSGILIGKQDSIYTVLTNDHILLSSEPPYQVQTFDNKIHQAKLIKRKDSLENNDLAILQFKSADHQYEVAQIGVTPKLEEPVFAAGFPLPARKWESKKVKPFARRGRVECVLNEALEGGYQVGYSSEVENGMSGGPLLNRFGQVVSINGLHAVPRWGNPYIYKDGSELSPNDCENMSQYSWGIPIETFLELELRKSQTQESQ